MDSAGSFIFIILVLFLIDFSTCSTNLYLKFYDNATESFLVCNDGSPGGYYIREATSADGKDKWIFYQEGGGWCYDDLSCLKRIATNHLISSKGWKDEISKSGIFDMEGTIFADANLVYLPYCSSDAHMTDTEREVPGYGAFQMRGRRMALEAVKLLVGSIKENQLVLFGGTSAGGRGSMVTIDAVRDLLHPTTVLRGLHDSGAYQDIDVYPDKHYTPFGEQCRRAYEYYDNPETNQKCSDAYPDELWKCLCGEYMLPLVETPSQVQIFQYDSYQLGNELGSPKRWTEDMCTYAENDFRSGMLNTVQELSSADSPHVVFAPACYQHGMLTSSKFWSEVTVNGGSVTAQSQLLAWLSDSEKLDGVSTCDGVNCEEACPHVDISNEARACIKNES